MGYEDIAIVLLALPVYFKWKSDTAISEAGRVFFSLVSIWSLVLVMGAGVAMAATGTYGASLNSVAGVAYGVAMFVAIIITIMDVVGLFFAPLMPPKQRKMFAFD